MPLLCGLFTGVKHGLRRSDGQRSGSLFDQSIRRLNGEIERYSNVAGIFPIRTISLGSLVPSGVSRTKSGQQQGRKMTAKSASHLSDDSTVTLSFVAALINPAQIKGATPLKLNHALGYDRLRVPYEQPAVLIRVAPAPEPD
jgi:hypothetical protein